ncbi:MAG: hypothetical protein A3H72_01805 [Candidatus Doudnabacteria bacterium RIFCSPLOWO2_02_FULL_48_8]|uniref:TrpR like protein, YerC/YecD n=1 Tax=Candidatus Doudnabacteria bacterium RIFCSPHIGHO2_01_FULL_46_24 TaxID=1817825 RepID=A0A1F5NW55_9BACT|nr:MAG: hypothetical protein A2720_00230 [Candidatus Doudnabacteria bacterium RIFCSPHIGHO2_01_FULL_46_24]OGE94971.1 MAG: hypothetical protein A3H72_01805 [Candidatus Doudnabacteria bacterium RIFCSPLOWO2_02_FULL_48_8]OGE96178.1 MAG: hypothetical protein A3E98_04410 [Candidatus Doudnabacteria bacterium RIFCSPHIGHO2_12_FULL_48_11]
MGASYKLNAKLTKSEQNELFMKLARAVASLHNPVEVAQFLKDLLSEPESFMLARRLQIADLLMQGLTYEQIRKKIKVAYATIAKVQTWLQVYGEGYRTVIQRINKPSIADEDETKPFAKLKRKYPMYFWPELLLKEIVRAANKRERERLLKVVSQMKEKTGLSKELTVLLRQ